MENQNEEELKTVAVKVYPLATTDDFFYEDEADEQLGIETKIYDNNKRKVLRVMLSDGRAAVIRTLKGRDIEMANRIHKGNQEQYFPSLIAIATSINGEGKVMEDFLDMDAPDYNKIRTANMRINF